MTIELEDSAASSMEADTQAVLSESIEEETSLLAMADDETSLDTTDVSDDAEIL